ncbi:MAG: glycosyltransferase [Gemmatimonadaceae bacterium]
MTRVALFRRPFLTDGRPEFISKTLRASNYSVTETADDAINPSDADVVWIQDNINWFPTLRRQLFQMPKVRRPFVVVWLTEPLRLPSAAGYPPVSLNAREIAKIVLRDARATDPYTNYQRLKQAAERGVPDLLVVSSRSRQTFLAEKGIESEFVPLGYYEGLGRDMQVSRDIDVLFLGTLDDPRHRTSVEYLRSNGVAIHALGDWHDPKYWDDARTLLINRTRIFLNIQRNAGELSGHRMILGMANMAMVLSEPIFDPFPYEPGRHYLSASLPQMADTIDLYLADDKARNEIAAAGHEFVTTRLTMDQSVSRIVSMIEERSQKGERMNQFAAHSRQSM